MVREFKLPDVGEGVAEGEIVRWLVAPGDAVTEDQPVAEVETDKAVVEVPSPVDGTVRELRAEEGEMVPVGEVIITFDVEGEPDESESEPESGEAAGPDETDAAGTAEPAPEAADGESVPEGRVFAAPSARRLARELGVDVAAVDGSGPGGRVTERDVRDAAAAGTDEPAGTAASPDDAEPGDAGSDAGGDGKAEAGTEPADASPVDSGPGAAGTAAADRDRTLAAPATRRVAEELGVGIDAVPATERRDGEAFVTEQAVREYAEAQRAAQEADAEALAEAGKAGEARQVAGDREERIPYRGIRRSIGDHLVEAKYTAPHVTHHDHADVTELVETREKLEPHAEEQGIKLTFMPFVMKAVAAALAEYPMLNSQLDEENEEIVYKHYYNIGVATATDQGLLVPVVENVGEKGLLQLSSEVNELVEKARERSIARSEMQGGTFTISNFGAVGGEYGTPIVNYPETAILGLGAIKDRPWVVDSGTTESSRNANGGAASGKEVVPRKVITLSLSFDHRVIDGAEAGMFTNAVKEYLEDPSLLLLE